jgi:tRNA nucleotidyltransferase (CCA-adding enzyme)
MTSIKTADKFIAALGVEAYRVGGSVRDELLGKHPKDADYMVRGVSLATLSNLLPRDRIAVSKLTLRDGQHVGYRVGKPFDIEIVLPRKEISTGPGHGDFKIISDPDITLAEDAQRRDFTFNALYKPVGILYDLGGLVAVAGLHDPVIVDPTGRGLHDLERKLIHTTHPDSFRDDPLRILRALRFVAQGFDLSTDTHLELAEHRNAATGLTGGGNASGTVLTEMSRILMGEYAVKALRLMRDSGVMAILFPELAPMLGFDQSSRYHDLTTDEHTFKALETAVKVDAPLRVRWALLFHDCGKPQVAWKGKDGRKHYYAQPGFDGPWNVDHEVASERYWRYAAERMNADKALREDVATLIRHHMVTWKKRGVVQRVHRMRIQFGDALTKDLLLHRMCDLTGKGSGVDHKHLEQLGEMEYMRVEAQRTRVPATVKDLAIDGEDLKLLGIYGRDIGLVLRAVLDEVACDPSEMKRGRIWQVNRAEALR